MIYFQKSILTSSSLTMSICRWLRLRIALCPYRPASPSEETYPHTPPPLTTYPSTTRQPNSPSHSRLFNISNHSYIWLDVFVA